MTHVVVTTGSRLHFGLTRVCADENAILGGIGVMVESPRTCLRMSLIRQLVKKASNRTEKFSRAWLDHLRNQSGVSFDQCFVDTVCIEMPPRHAGLGSGTQLAQATAAGINRLLGLPPANAIEVAHVLDRGQRSLIGSLGFEHGGLIVDRPFASFGPPCCSNDCLSDRVMLPNDWRVILIQHPATKRTFGNREEMLFKLLEQRPCPEAVILESLIKDALVPAARRAEFSGFCEAVYEYGWRSGLYYREIQGGPYNGRVVTEIVDLVRKTGVQGVGQSSWGPVVFAWCSDQDQASSICRQLRQSMDSGAVIEVTRVRNEPAEVLLN